MTQETIDGRIRCVTCGAHGAPWRCLALVEGLGWVCSKCLVGGRCAVPLFPVPADGSD